MGQLSKDDLEYMKDIISRIEKNLIQPGSRRIPRPHEFQTGEQLTSIRILGMDYKINYHDMVRTSGCHDIGNTTPVLCQINISTSRSCPQQERSTILEEVLHILDFSLELDLSHSTVSQLTAGLIQIINDNPKFVRFLQRKELEKPIIAEPYLVKPDQQEEKKPVVTRGRSSSEMREENEQP